MEPSNKSKEITEFLEEFSGRSTAIKSGHCISFPLGCGRVVAPAEFFDWNNPTRREYQISGMCNNCQDAVFGKDGDEW
ncbi:MAG: hypothetical protein ACREHG_03990 [Candidatus Saccharimonadales bacterium]